LTCSL